MTVTVDDLLMMQQKELDDLFSAHEAGPIPDGEGEGTAIIAPGTPRSRILARMISHFAWQGKVFDAEHGTLRNHVLALGIKAIVAQVYKGPSHPHSGPSRTSRNWVPTSSKAVRAAAVLAVVTAWKVSAVLAHAWTG